MDDRIRDDNGKFIKGVTPNKNGRKKKADIEKERIQEVLNSIYREAAGDPVKAWELQLERAAELNLSLDRYNRIARELAPYKTGKRAPIDEEGNTAPTGFNIVFPGMGAPALPDNTIKTINEVKDD